MRTSLPSPSIATYTLSIMKSSINPWIWAQSWSDCKAVIMVRCLVLPNTNLASGHHNPNLHVQMVEHCAVRGVPCSLLCTNAAPLFVPLAIVPSNQHRQPLSIEMLISSSPTARPTTSQILRSAKLVGGCNPRFRGLSGQSSPYALKSGTGLRRWSTPRTTLQKRMCDTREDHNCGKKCDSVHSMGWLARRQPSLLARSNSHRTFHNCLGILACLQESSVHCVVTNHQVRVLWVVSVRLQRNSCAILDNAD